MKTKKSILFFVSYMLLGAVFTIFFTACNFFNESPHIIRVKSLSDAEEKLAEYSPIGNTPDYPIHLMVSFDFGDMSKPDNNYLRLLEIIGKYGLYCELVGGSTTVFTSPPLTEAAKGMDKIVKISIPVSTTRIALDANGKSPFFFYENLISVSTISTSKVTHVDDYAFSSCKSLKGVSLYSVKTVGREVFIGCEKLMYVSFTILLETIGDKAFFDCSALESIYLPGKPPALGDSVFLGSTPDKFTIEIKKEYESAYRTWLTENASKFNNDGADVVFKVWD